MSDHRIVRIPVGCIRSSVLRARKDYDEASIAALAESIRRFGLLSPLLLRRKSAGEYELIAGERRLRALKKLGCRDADSILLSAYDSDCALISLVENIQRENLHFFEEAEACRRILEEGRFSREELAAALGRSSSALANRIRLLQLDPELRAYLRDQGLSERHARALLRLCDPDQRRSAARLASEQAWSVRRLEEHISRLLQPPPPPPSPPPFRDRRLVINAFEDTLRRLRDIGVRAERRIEHREESYDIIVTIRCDPGPPHKTKPPPAPKG